MSLEELQRVEVCPTCLGEGVEIFDTLEGDRYEFCTQCGGVGCVNQEPVR